MGKSISLISKLMLVILVIIVPFLAKNSNNISKTNLSFGLPLVNAQNLRPETVAAEVYQIFPSLSSENQYFSQETKEVDADNTLISRLIRYHQYVKNRPLKYRLDWKLTLADYFGVNEPIREFRYPGSSTLQSNPLEGDRAVIKSLSRLQRNQLVDTLVSIYSGQQQNSSQPNSPASDRSLPSNSSPLPQLPQPGDADLLLP